MTDYETATEQVHRINAKAIELAQRDLRFRRLVDVAVAKAMSDHGRVNPERAERDAHRIATNAAMTVAALILEGDAELVAAREERDHYRNLAINGMNLKPIVMLAPSSERIDRAG